MNKYHLLFTFCFWLSGMFSQSTEIGISLLDLTTIRTDKKQSDTLSHSKRNGIFNLKPVLTYNHINSKGVDAFAQFGYFYLPQKVLDKTFDGGRAVYWKSEKSLQKSVYLKLGIAKRYTKDRLTLISGLNVPFEYCYYKKSDSYITIYTKGNDTLAAENVVHDSYAPEYTTGINLQQSAYYTFGKHLMIGIDLNLGLRAFIINGVRNRKESTTYYLYPSNNSATDDHIRFKHSLQTSLYFQPAISIKYNFQTK